MQINVGFDTVTSYGKFKRVRIKSVRSKQTRRVARNYVLRDLLAFYKSVYLSGVSKLEDLKSSAAESLQLDV